MTATPTPQPTPWTVAPRHDGSLRILDANGDPVAPTLIVQAGNASPALLEALEVLLDTDHHNQHGGIRWAAAVAHARAALARAREGEQ